MRKSFLEKILEWFKTTFNPRFEIKEKEEEKEEQKKEQETENQLEESKEEEIKEKINIAKRTITKRLYVLEQEIAVFKEMYPKEAQTFLDKIQKLKTEYIETLEKSKEKLTFEIDPEINGAKKEEIIKIEREVESFINKEVRFKKISQKLQKLIVMLNTLYNVSIVHSKPNEKQKALQQLENAKNKTIEIAKEFKTSEEILKDPRLKERVIDLMSYAEYLTLKISIRNSNQTPKEAIKSLTIIRDFKNFDYINAFLAFVIEEISCGIRNKISILSNELLDKIKEKERKLLEETFYEENFLYSTNFWNEFMQYETDVISILGVSGENAKIPLLPSMKITVKIGEVLDVPITECKYTLIKNFATTNDNKILLTLKFLAELSKEVTYKEIYFTLLTFDVLHYIDETPNELKNKIKKYEEKYNYSREKIAEKRKAVKNIKNATTEYLVVFELKESEEEINNILRETLTELNFDFVETENKILLNSFYFTNLKNIMEILKLKTNNQ